MLAAFCQVHSRDTYQFVPWHVSAPELLQKLVVLRFVVYSVQYSTITSFSKLIITDSMSLSRVLSQRSDLPYYSITDNSSVTDRSSVILTSLTLLYNSVLIVKIRITYKL